MTTGCGQYCFWVKLGPDGPQQDFRDTQESRLSRCSSGCLKGAKRGHDANKASKEKAAPSAALQYRTMWLRPALFARAARPPQSARPRSHHRVFKDCGDHVRVFGHYYSFEVPASSANIRHARAHQGTFARRHYRIAKRKKAEAHDAVIPARTRGRRRWATTPDAIASLRSRTSFYFSSYHTRSRVDFGNTGRGHRCSHRPAR
jgi:hypothetical protein